MNVAAVACPVGSFCPGFNASTACKGTAVRCPAGSGEPLLVDPGFVADANGHQVPCRAGHACLGGVETESPGPDGSIDSVLGDGRLLSRPTLELIMMEEDSHKSCQK